MLRWFVIVPLLVALGGCASTLEDPTEGWSAKQLYENAKAELDAGNFQQAIEYFETLEARYPFGDYALQTQLEIAYAYFKFGETDSAIAAVDRFVKLNPRHERLDYAFYLRGLANSKRSRGLFEPYFPKDLAFGDQRVLQQAFNDFAKVIEYGEDSRYRDDARKRMVYLRNKMAEHGIITAEYYADRGALVAAAKRLNQVLVDFPHTPHTPRVLATLADIYARLGIDDLAADTRRVLAANTEPAPTLAASADGAAP